MNVKTFQDTRAVIFFKKLSKSPATFNTLAVPAKPWQNGKAENHIKVLCNIARTNMVASGLAGRYWARVITYAAEVTNVQFRADIKMSP